MLYINPGFVDGDGSETAPWSSFADAFADINTRPTRESKFTLYVEGSVDENVVIDGTLNTDELEICRKPGTSSGTVRHIKVGGTSPLPAGFRLTIHDLTLSASGSGNTDELGTGLVIDQDMEVLLENVDIVDCSHFGLHVKHGNVTYVGGHITGNSADPSVSQYHGNVAVYLQNNSVTSFTDTAINSNHVFGIVLEQTATCNITGGSISQNGASAFYFASTAPVVNVNGTSITQNNKGAEWDSSSSGSLNLQGNTAISQNTSGGIELGSSGSLNIKGAVSVTSNTMVPAAGGAAVAANVILPVGKKINITGALTSGCSIGVTTASTDEPTVIGNKYSFTNGYSTYNSSSPSTYFTSDRSFGVVPDSGEAGIALGGATGELPYSSFDYTINFTAKEMDGTTAATGMYYGVEKSILLVPTVTRSGTAVTPTTSGGLLKIDDVNADLSIALYNGGSKAADISAANITDGGSGKLKVTLPADIVSYTGSYTLKVRATYLGLNHDANFALKIDNGADNAAQYISIQTSGTTNVKVSGPVGPGATEGLAKVANAIKNLPSGVLINLDATETNNTQELEDYNSGEYFKDCLGLHKIELPEWMEQLIPNLFNGCSSLQEVDIPDTITNIRTDAFKNCTSLTTVTFAGTIDQWKAINRTPGWHAGVPAATEVHCSDGNCSLDERFPPIGSAYMDATPDSIAVGDIAFKDGSYVHYSSSLTLTSEQQAAAIAVIFYIGDECNNSGETGNRTLGVGLVQTASQSAFGANGSAAGDNVQYSTMCYSSSDSSPYEPPFSGRVNGKDNYTLVSGYSETNTPAFWWANHYSEQAGTHVSDSIYESEWYFPSMGELYQLYLNRTNVENSLLKCNGTTFGTTSYRTSSQGQKYDKPKLCWGINFGTGELFMPRKYDSGYSALAIHEF